MFVTSQEPLSLNFSLRLSKLPIALVSLAQLIRISEFQTSHLFILRDELLDTRLLDAKFLMGIFFLLRIRVGDQTLSQCSRNHNHLSLGTIYCSSSMDNQCVM